MSEDVKETVEQQITTRSGRSFGVGPVGDSGDILSVPGARPSASAAHLASSPSVESQETQLGSEVELIVTTSTESLVSVAATQMNLPVGSPPPSAPREAESNTCNTGRPCFERPSRLRHISVNLRFRKALKTYLFSRTF